MFIELNDTSLFELAWNVHWHVTSRARHAVGARRCSSSYSLHQLITGRCVFDLSVSGGSGDLEGVGGRGKIKTENKGGPGGPAPPTGPRRGPNDEK